MKKNNWSLSTLYKMCDKAGTKTVTIVDFQNALKGCLDANEANKLFSAIDHDRSQTCSEEEMIAELAIINAATVFDKIRDTISRGNISIHEMFESCDHDRDNALSIDEFAELIKTTGNTDCRREEIEILFNSVDKSGQGAATLQDIKEALSKTLSLQNVVAITHMDICTPLATHIKNRLQLNAGQVFP